MPYNRYHSLTIQKVRRRNRQVLLVGGDVVIYNDTTLPLKYFPNNEKSHKLESMLKNMKDFTNNFPVISPGDFYIVPLNRINSPFTLIPIKGNENEFSSSEEMSSEKENDDFKIEFDSFK
jgi:hypothetical protein